MTSGGSTGSQADQPAFVVHVDGRNNTRLAIPVATFLVAGVRMSDVRPPLTVSERDGHLEVLLGAAAGRYVADVAGLPAQSRDWPERIDCVSDWVAGGL